MDYSNFDLRHEQTAGIQYCRSALQSVSRSFAFTIPMIEPELRDKITVGYVVARVLDTLEDSPIPLEMKKAMMDEWISIISEEPAGSVSLGKIYQRTKKIVSESSKYVADVAYSELMKNAFKVYAAVTNFDKPFILSQHRWFREMKEGMKKYLTRRITTFKDFDEYTYYVAGTVGGFLTDLVCEGMQDEARKAVLKSTYRDFGLFLQKVNIIRDFREDVLEGRYFWPKELIGNRNDADLLKAENSEFALAALEKMISDAKAHMPGARTYIDSIPPRFRGYRAFALVNFYMAVKTLELMERNKGVFLSAAPLKISKSAVIAILKRAESES